jgi:hypothetical protein
MIQTHALCAPDSCVNVGDSIHVDFSQEEAYPLDKENISKFDL